ncbi:MAG: transposase, partial [Burkholderiales bacterium]
IEVDKESSDGYERTTTVSGRRVHEKWSKSSKRAEVQTVVGKRFLVEVDAEGLEMNEVKALVAKINLDQLDAMKSEGLKKN